MTKLSEIEAIKDLNKRHEMMQQWGQDRGFNHSYPGLAVMRYIERLEAALQSIANNTCCSTCQEAKLVARKALALHELEGER